MNIYLFGSFSILLFFVLFLNMIIYLFYNVFYVKNG